ncbi:MAG: glycosyltransferase, partial [Firmicutes bacterium]|nr:glycosyltransferase [Bacillota bacterium]
MRSDKSPAVSVILPVYNIGGYLEQCMESLADQTFRDIEILLID